MTAPTESEGNPSVEQLLDTFSLKSSIHVATRCEALRRHHITFRAHELRTVLDQSRDLDVNRNLSTAIQSLSNQSLLRVLEAPETLAHLLAFQRGHHLAALDFLWAAVEAESGVTPGGPKPSCWTALGDHYVSDLSDAYTAPTHGGVWIIDCRSPFGRDGLGLINAEGLPQLRAAPSEDDDRAIVEKLCLALNALELTSPAAHALVAGSVRTILPRSATSAAPGFTSVSSRPRTGRAVLVDAHLPGVSTARIAGALVHEAIHSYLYRLELADTIVHHREADETIYSPWTGSSLRLRTYVHACFIHFALTCVWRQREARRMFDREEVERLQLFEQAGFANRDWLTRLRPHVATLNPAVYDQLCQMQDLVSEDRVV
jgi:hypothetical protein